MKTYELGISNCVTWRVTECLPGTQNTFHEQQPPVLPELPAPPPRRGGRAAPHPASAGMRLRAK